MDIWDACRPHIKPQALEGDMLRLVENQDSIAISELVDSLEQQALLETLLESAGTRASDDDKHLHRLLATPFRQPPLPWGSRFGTRFESGLFYGSRDISTLLAEAAYYRLIFWHDMAESPPTNKLLTQHHVIGASYATARGLQLQYAPFSDFQGQLTHPSDYAPTQALGRNMRANHIEVFEYLSARDPARGHNIALFTPAALTVRQPLFQHLWLCDTRAEFVTFHRPHTEHVHRYELAQFLEKERLPRPA